MYSFEAARLEDLDAEGAEVRFWAATGRAATPLVVAVDALTVRSAPMLLLVEAVVEPVAGPEPGLVDIAEVDRRAAGRRPSLSRPNEEDGLWSCASPPTSPFSRALGFLVLTGEPFGD